MAISALENWKKCEKIALSHKRQRKNVGFMYQNIILKGS